MTRCSRAIVVSGGPLCADQANHVSCMVCVLYKIEPLPQVNLITVPPKSISDQQHCNVIGIEVDSTTSNTVAGTC